jgi:hypothetical protein
MTVEIPADLHPDCVPLAWLLGTWQGSGHGDYPTIERFSFGQEIGFAHDSRPFLHYFSRSWLVGDDGTILRPAALETGFVRAHPGGEVEVTLAHQSGFVEIWYGRVDGAKLEISTDVVARTHSAEGYTSGRRLYGLVEGDLLWAFDMAAMGQPLQSHTWARLRRAPAPASFGA